MKPVVLTSGEPAGIGPELMGLISASEGPLPAPEVPVVILGDAHLLANRAQAAEIEARHTHIQSLAQAREPGYFVLHHPLKAPCHPGRLDPDNGQYVLDLLDQACDWCTSGQAGGMVTAPIQKSTVSPIYSGFQGHTEYLAQRCGAEQVVMMLQGGGLRVALASTHLPLQAVPAAITRESLTSTLLILLHDLKYKFGLEQPRVLVAGLNPHAGESGTMGQEEQTVIKPVIEALQAQGHMVSGPYPADTLFQPKYLENADAVLAMYHDQGLPVLKFASFGQGINITLGLPIIRTSVDHGTALDLAGTNKMNPGSLKEALQLAIDLSKGLAS